MMELYSEAILSPTTLISGLLVLGGIIFTFFFFRSEFSLPLLNEKKPSEFWRRNAKKRFLSDARAIITSGFSSVRIEHWKMFLYILLYDIGSANLIFSSSRKVREKMLFIWSQTRVLKWFSIPNTSTKFAITNNSAF